MNHSKPAFSLHSGEATLCGATLSWAGGARRRTLLAGRLASSMTPITQQRRGRGHPHKQLQTTHKTTRIQNRLFAPTSSEWQQGWILLPSKDLAAALELLHAPAETASAAACNLLPRRRQVFSAHRSSGA